MTIVPAAVPLAGSAAAPAAPRFGRVAPPPITHRDIPPDLNTAWDRLGPRRPRFLVLHRMAGTLAGTDEYFRTEARHRARTDYGIDHATGAIWRWTDPLGELSPWASGPWTAPPGPGGALVRRLGVAAINRDGVSVEIAGWEGDAVSDVAIDRLARLVAYWADRAGVPHGGWPLNPETGLPFVYGHADFYGGKSCPGPIVRALTPRLLARAGEILRAAQTGGSEAAPPPGPTAPSRPPSGIELPDGVTVADLTAWFGGAALPGGDGRWFGFDPAGPLSQLWLERGRDSAVWPALATVARSGTTLTFRFADGWTVRSHPDGTVVEVAD